MRKKLERGANFTILFQGKIIALNYVIFPGVIPPDPR